jgi:hypothetical protein
MLMAPINTSASVANRFAGVLQLIHDPTIADVSPKEAAKGLIALSNAAGSPRLCRHIQIKFIAVRDRRTQGREGRLAGNALSDEVAARV